MATWEGRGAAGHLAAAVAVAVLTTTAYRALILAMTVSLTICFSITGVTDPENDGLWGVGATMVAVGKWAATWTVVSLLAPVHPVLVGRRAGPKFPPG